MLRPLLEGRVGIVTFVAWIMGVVIAITVHEFAHAKRAQLAGDPTPAQDGRITLNPIAHLDPLGTIMLLVFGLGWGRPVRVNPVYFRRGRRDNLMVSLWGPMSNFVLAAVLAVPLRLGLASQREELLQIIIFVNLLLGFFNLLPVHPLDGSHVVESLLPPRSAMAFSQFSHRYGIIVLLAVILTPLGEILFVAPAEAILRLLIGI